MGRAAAWITGLVLLGAIGCDDGGSEDAGPADAEARLDAAPECLEHPECDDGFFCNGEERCEEGRCEEGPPPDCRDGIECTVDRCDELTRACVSAAPDRDEDGFGDAACVDDDGVALGMDCDDADPDRFPGNRELCDEADHDEDCDPSTFGEVDADGDGEPAARCCNEDDDGVRACGTDCDDTRAGVNGRVPEVCNNFDDDCDGMVDEGVRVTGYVDADFDGHGDPARAMTSCGGRLGFSELADDCDDADATIHGGAAELCEGVDNDCDGTVDESPVEVDWYRDADGDGFGAASSGVITDCAPQPGYTLTDLDCDDAVAAVNPAAPEQCNGRDDDCVGGADFAIGVNDTEDDDGDGFVDLACGDPFGVDCDDSDPRTGAGEPEICDGRDNDCDGRVDEGATEALWYRDADMDGWGSERSGVMVGCRAIAGYVARGGDCDDADPDVSPDAAETCNGIDDDCDGAVDDGSALTSCTLANASSTCFGGRCRVDRCVDGFDDCNGDDADGCEQAVDSAAACGCGALDCARPGAVSPRCVRADPREPYRCEFDCEVDRGDCDGNVLNGCETPTDLSPDHCGGCGMPCPGGSNGRAVCASGTCGFECFPGWGDCDGDPSNGCESPLDAPSDCGACDAACPSDPSFTPVCRLDPIGRFACQIESCTVPGTADCNFDLSDGCETDTQTDPDHCGGCGFRCFDPDSACAGGTCVTQCPAGFDDCDRAPFNGCEVDLSSDPRNCGSCGAACPADHDCTPGSGCTLACPPGRGSCDGIDANGCETDLSNDPMHCNGCGMACDPDHLCFGGTCVLSCTFPFDDCDGMPGNGCETDTQMDPAHCGGCDAACPPDHACNFGGCDLFCPMDRGDCDANPGNGCEETLTGNDAHCGSCGNACGTNSTCDANGTCKCDAGFLDCDAAPGCEVDETRDPDHCGGCGVSCGGGTVCVEGGCENVVDVAAGADFTCALFSSGRVYCWGSNAAGQLGDGMAPAGSNVPVQVTGLVDAIAITAGNRHACAIRVGGEVMCWGSDTVGQIGPLCGGAAMCTTPTQVVGILATRVVAGGDHTCAIVNGSGTEEAWCWGAGTSGQLGNNTVMDSESPQQVDVTMLPPGTFPIRLALGQDFSCMVTDTLDLACWGSDASGQHGDGVGDSSSARPLSASVLAGPIDEIEAGFRHACARIGADAYCWGSSSFGQTGQGVTGTNHPSAVQVMSLTDARQLAMGGAFSCVTRTLDRVACWGSDGGGALGNGAGGDQLLPGSVASPLDGIAVMRISAGASGAQHACALAFGGELYCWGDNSFGQIGDGTFTQAQSPRRVGP